MNKIPPTPSVSQVLRSSVYATNDQYTQRQIIGDFADAYDSRRPPSRTEVQSLVGLAKELLLEEKNLPDLRIAAVRLFVKTGGLQSAGILKELMEKYKGLNDYQTLVVTIQDLLKDLLPDEEIFKKRKGEGKR